MSKDGNDFVFKTIGSEPEHFVTRRISGPVENKIGDFPVSAEEQVNAALGRIDGDARHPLHHVPKVPKSKASDQCRDEDRPRVRAIELEISRLQTQVVLDRKLLRYYQTNQQSCGLSFVGRIMGEIEAHELEIERLRMRLQLIVSR
jgi:hypothetical protein